MTNLLQKHWEWLENRKEAALHGAHRFKTMCFGQLGREDSFRRGLESFTAEIPLHSK